MKIGKIISAELCLPLNRITSVNFEEIERREGSLSMLYSDVSGRSLSIKRNMAYCSRNKVQIMQFHSTQTILKIIQIGSLKPGQRCVDDLDKLSSKG